MLPKQLGWCASYDEVDNVNRVVRASAVFIVSLSLALGAFGDTAPHPVADWIRSAVVYELNTRAFSESGNFRGIEDRLDNLKDLGVTIVWLMPISPVGQVKKKGTLGSPYAVRDYYAIDPAYGTKDDLKRLVAAAHTRGLKVIVDVVINHTAWDNVLIKQHPEFYKKDAQGNIIPPDPAWTDVAGLDYRNPQLRTYMIEMLKYWLKEFDLDGFRCDVAWGVPVDFWDTARAELEKVKPQIVMIAEANQPDLLTKAFDLDYAWPFMHTIDDVMENGLTAQGIMFNWQKEHEKFGKAIEMRMLDDHDERRVIGRLGERGMLAASALIFTSDGVPLLYNGMEAGDTTESRDPALFENLKVFWDIVKVRTQFLPFYKQMIALRKAHPALQQGETEWLRNGAQDRVLTYIRRGAGEEFFVAINCSNQPFAGVAEIPDGEYEDVTPKHGDEAANKVSPPAVVLGAWEFRIYRKAK